MAVEIKELVIRAVAEDQSAESGSNTKPSGWTAEREEAIIEACVRQVLKILERKETR